DALAAVGRDAALEVTRLSLPNREPQAVPRAAVREAAAATAEGAELSRAARTSVGVQAVATPFGGNGTMTQATRRKTFNLPGLAPAGSVAPDLVQVGNLFFTSAVRGVNLATGRLGETPEEQFTLAWRNLRSLVEGAGLSL